jgi:hypothetical protein
MWLQHVKMTIQVIPQYTSFPSSIHPLWQQVCDCNLHEPLPAIYSTQTITNEMNLFHVTHKSKSPNFTICNKSSQNQIIKGR